MWPLFGFIPLISLLFLSYKKKHDSSWGGILSFEDGLAFKYRIFSGRLINHGVNIGIDSLPGYDYILKKETSIDKLFKFIGLSNEHQVGDEKFDDLIYIISDKKEFHRQLSSNQEILKIVDEIFKTSTKYHCKTIAIFHNSGKLWVKLIPKRQFDKDNIVVQSIAVAKLLNKLSAEIETIPNYPSKGWKEPHVIKAMAILSVSTSMLVYAFFQFVWLRLVIFPFIVDDNILLQHAIYLGSSIVLILIIITIVILERSAKTHLIIIELLIIGMIGAVITSYSVLRTINIQYDNSAITEYTAQVSNKLKKGGRHDRYYFHLSDWLEENSQKVRVTEGLYNSVSKGDFVVVHQREGSLNYRWVSSIEKKP